jgi:hypothetical protein
MPLPHRALQTCLSAASNSSSEFKFERSRWWRRWRAWRMNRICSKDQCQATSSRWRIYPPPESCREKFRSLFARERRSSWFASSCNCKRKTEEYIMPRYKGTMQHPRRAGTAKGRPEVTVYGVLTLRLYVVVTSKTYFKKIISVFYSYL